jgi:hypothetical protein
MKRVSNIEILDLEQGLASIFGERTPCKKLANLHPRHGNLLQRNNFRRSTEPLFTSQNRVEISWKKYPFFSNTLLMAKLLRFLWFWIVVSQKSKLGKFRDISGPFIAKVSEYKVFWKNGLMSLLLPLNSQILSQCYVYNSIAKFSQKTSYPGGIRTWVFCSWSGCDVHCATPPGLQVLSSVPGCFVSSLDMKPRTLVWSKSVYKKVPMYVCMYAMSYLGIKLHTYLHTTSYPGCYFHSKLWWKFYLLNAI